MSEVTKSNEYRLTVAEKGCSKLMNPVDVGKGVADQCNLAKIGKTNRTGKLD